MGARFKQPGARIRAGSMPVAGQLSKVTPLSGFASSDVLGLSFSPWERPPIPGDPSSWRRFEHLEPSASSVSCTNRAPVIDSITPSPARRSTRRQAPRPSASGGAAVNASDRRSLTGRLASEPYAALAPAWRHRRQCRLQGDWESTRRVARRARSNENGAGAKPSRRARRSPRSCASLRGLTGFTQAAGRRRGRTRDPTQAGQRRTRSLALRLEPSRERQAPGRKCWACRCPLGQAEFLRLPAPQPPPARQPRKGEQLLVAA
jgi:hypothetical protein